MKDISFVAFAVLFLLSAPPDNALGKTFCVRTATELHDALFEAQANSFDDEIQIVQGTYSGNFEYWSTDGKDIAIAGGYLKAGILCHLPLVPPSPSATVLDGGNAGRVLGIYNKSGGAVTVVRLTIRNGNSMGSGGGGVLAVSESSGQPGMVEISNNIIENNHSGENGGGAYARTYSSGDTSNVVLFNDNVVRNNNAALSGGGVAAFSNSETGKSAAVGISGNTYTNNVAGFGGGMYAQSWGKEGTGQVFIEKNIVLGNKSQGGGEGGGISIESNTLANDFGTIDLTNNIIADNESDGYGGGLSAILNSGDNSGEMILTHNTITGNSAAMNGGGINYGSYQVLELNNNIIWNNLSPYDGDDIMLASWVTARAHSNDISHMYGSFATESNTINIDPRFVGGGDYHLRSFSPCRDKGSGAVSLPATDIDGDNRVIFAAPDLGADEIAELPSSLFFPVRGKDGETVIIFLR